jgi:hypothetical protein
LPGRGEGTLQGRTYAQPQSNRAPASGAPKTLIGRQEQIVTAQHRRVTVNALAIFGCTLGEGSMGKTRERQIILKTVHRTVLLELDLGGKFQAKSSGWGENRPFSKAMFLKLQYAMAAGC